MYVLRVSLSGLSLGVVSRQGRRRRHESIRNILATHGQHVSVDKGDEDDNIDGVDLIETHYEQIRNTLGAQCSTLTVI
jgi:hypothetical protein